MNWIVETLNHKVDVELETLDATCKAKFLHIAEMLETFGPHRVREPYVKHLTGKLWEIRMKGKTGIARAIYTVRTTQRIVILHVFVKKTQKTPKHAIQLAQQRAQEII